MLRDTPRNFFIAGAAVAHGSSFFGEGRLTYWALAVAFRKHNASCASWPNAAAVPCCDLGLVGQSMQADSNSQFKSLACHRRRQPLMMIAGLTRQSIARRSAAVSAAVAAVWRVLCSISNMTSAALYCSDGPFSSVASASARRTAGILQPQRTAAWVAKCECVRS